MAQSIQLYISTLLPVYAILVILEDNPATDKNADYNHNHTCYNLYVTNVWKLENCSLWMD